MVTRRAFVTAGAAALAADWRLWAAEEGLPAYYGEHLVLTVHTGILQFICFLQYIIRKRENQERSVTKRFFFHKI